MDDANHLWATSYIYHPCYSSDTQPNPSGNSSHAHIVLYAEACRQSLTVGGGFLNFLWGKQKTFYCREIGLHCLIKPSVIRFRRAAETVLVDRPKIQFLLSRSLVLSLKTICGDIKMSTHLTDSPGYIWWLAAARCWNFFSMLPMKVDYERQPPPWTNSRELAEDTKVILSYKHRFLSLQFIITIVIVFTYLLILIDQNVCMSCWHEEFPSGLIKFKFNSIQRGQWQSGVFWFPAQLNHKQGTAVNHDMT